MVAPLRAVAVKRPAEAFGNAAGEWRELSWTRVPDLKAATEEHNRLVSLLETARGQGYFLPEDTRTNIDSLYAHDPVLVTDAGAVILQMGKAARRGEGQAMADALQSWEMPVLGVVDGDATAEAGDMIWLDRRTLLVGRGLRTN